MIVNPVLSTATHLRLTSAVLVYEGDGQKMVTLNPVNDSGEVEPGELLSRSVWADLVAGIAKGDEKQYAARKLLHPRLLFADPSRIVWFHPAHRRQIFFKTGRTAFDEALNGQEVWHPALLLLAMPSNLYVFALDHGGEGGNNEQITEDTPVFVAPYFNLYRDGHMCRGNVRLPDRASADDIPIWEESFFSTNFTHSNRGDKLTTHPGGHDGVWQAAMSEEFSWQGNLLKEPLTVGEVLNR